VSVGAVRFVLVGALLIAAVDASAFCRTTTSRSRSEVPGECATTGIPLSWRNRCTGYSLYRLDVPEDIAFPDLDRLAATSTGAWARAACDDNGRVPQYFRVLPNPPTLNPPGYNPTGPNSNTVRFRPRWGDDAIHRSGAIAITIVTFDSFTGEIFDADIEMNTQHPRTNPTGFRFSIADRPEFDAADLPTILTHEFGHFLGLSHSANERSVMWFEAGVGEARRDLTADDTAGICTIYPQPLAPPGRCVGLPYGGLATYPGPMKVTGACGVRPGVGATRTGLSGALAMALAAVCCGRRRRRV
jgi:hypothetical protein